MNKYFKWDEGDGCIYIVDVRNWDNSITKLANYYCNGKLYASLQHFIPRETDIEISETDFLNNIK